MDVSDNRATPTPGVTLYDFHVGSLPLLFMVEGDRPGYPHFGWKPEHEEDSTLASGLRAHCRSAHSGDHASRECLITLGPQSPKQLHVWYEQLTAPSSRFADDIIDSIAPKAP
jgi:hypothetical protein